MILIGRLINALNNNVRNQDFDAQDEVQWLQGYEWMIKTATKVNQVFRPILQGTAFG